MSNPINKDNMKKLALSFLASSLLAGVVVAGGCDYHQEVTMASNKPVLMFQLDDMKLMKYTSSNGTILYIIKNIEGETVAKDLDQNQPLKIYNKKINDVTEKNPLYGSIFNLDRKSVV